jgi:hypothetical protein
VKRTNSWPAEACPPLTSHLRSHAGHSRRPKSNSQALQTISPTSLVVNLIYLAHLAGRQTTLSPSSTCFTQIPYILLEFSETPSTTCPRRLRYTWTMIPSLLKMWLPVVTPCLLFLTSAGAVSVPHQPDTLQLDILRRHGLARRNDTASQAGELTLNVDPDIEYPSCGGIYNINVNVAFAPDSFYLSPACRNVLNYLGGNKGSKDVTIILVCTGEGRAPGVGDRDIKMIFNIGPNAVVSSPTPTPGGHSGKSARSPMVSLLFFLSATVGTQANWRSTDRWSQQLDADGAEQF